MKTFKLAAVLTIMALAVGTASADVLLSGTGMSGTDLDFGSTDGENLDLSSKGAYTWSYWENNGPVATWYKKGTAPVIMSADYSSEGGNQYGNPIPDDPHWYNTGVTKSKYSTITFTDGTTDGSDTVSQTAYQTKAHNAFWDPLGWVENSGKRGVIINGKNLDDDDPENDIPALDPEYGDTFDTYNGITVEGDDFNGAKFGTMTLEIPVAAGEGTATIYYTTRRVTYNLLAELSDDAGEFLSYETFAAGNHDRHELSINFDAEVDQTLTVQFVAQQVESDTNRYLGVQAVAVTPEPATMALLGIGGLGVLLKRKR